MADGRVEMQRLAYEAQVLEEQRQLIGQRMMQLQEFVAQASVAIETIKSIKGDSKAFVPVGAGAMVPAKVEAGNVLIDAGAGVVVEMKPDAAITLLEFRMKAITDLLSSAENDSGKLAQRLQAIESQARGLMSKQKPPSETEG